MAEKKQNLRLWQDRYAKERTEYEGNLNNMDRFEKLYRGDKAIMTVSGARADVDTPHVRNIVQEIIETQVDSNIPQPKVTALREEDAPKAKLIEDMLRNELDRLPMEEMNDLSERTCPIQGGDGFLLDWDITLGSHQSVGDVRISQIHPKKIIPQDGVERIEDMDWFFITEEKTKGFVKRRYGVDVEDETEEEPNARKVGGDAPADNMVTVVTAFYKNKDGGIGRFSWVNNTMLEDLDDFQARTLYFCKKCGEQGDGNRCRHCGSKKFEEVHQEYEELTDDLVLDAGEIDAQGNVVREPVVIPAMSPVRDDYGQVVMEDVSQPEMELPFGADGLMPQMQPPFANGIMSVMQEPVMEPTRIPYYKPNLYPLVMRKNISLYGEFLGASDVAAIEDQQNTANKISDKINTKILGGGSFITKPRDLKFKYNDKDGRVLELDTPQQMQQIQVFNTQVDISGDVAYRNMAYEEARQQIGITDSMQGRKDATATSAVAKEFSASQAAGRLESKRVMKQAAFAKLFELIFKMKLAYADEPRPVVAYNDKGEKEYEAFNRYDFLKEDDAGMYYWNDQFLFSCDNSAPLASNREALWQENRMNYQQGAYGAQDSIETQVLFWEIMEREHYPMAAVVKTRLQEQLERQREMEVMQAQMQAQVPVGGGVPTGGTALGQPGGAMPAGMPAGMM